MALARVKNWIAEALLFSDLNAEFNNILNNPGDLISGATVAVGLTETTPGTQPSRAIAYQYTAWDPIDLIGGVSNAPATAAATLAATNYITMANASGTLTLTFTKAGNYLIEIHGHNEVGAAPTNLQLNAQVGGTATRYIDPTQIGLIKTVSQQGNNAGTAAFMVTATANQTLTILPNLTVIGAGATTNYTTNCTVSAAYMGT